MANLFIVSAPSGAGKTSLVKAVVQSMSNVTVSISHTTRPKRPNEINHQHYHFVDDTEFKHMITHQAFLEYAEVFTHYYGTAKDNVLQQLQMGQDVILEIDWQGARQIREQLPDSVSIFILPPSLEILRQRLCERAQDNAEVIAQRMAQAHSEMSHYREYDYLIINDEFATAVQDFSAIIHSQRLAYRRQIYRQQSLLNQLLK